LRFSIRDGILRISSKNGDSLNAIFCPPENEPNRGNSQFRADKNKISPKNDFLINNVEHRQELNEKDSLKRHFRDPQIPFVTLFVSNPNDKHSPVMIRTMHDSGCAKTVIRKDIFESIPGYKEIPVTKMENVLARSCSGNKKKFSDMPHYVSYLKETMETKFPLSMMC
jgi:hypothetical protein